MAHVVFSVCVCECACVGKCAYVHVCVRLCVYVCIGVSASGFNFISHLPFSFTVAV